MPRGQHSIEIDASAQAVFDLIHNYDLRLQWDSMLCEAKLLDGATVAAEGTRSRCVGNWKCVWLPIESEYVSFESGKVAAVRMTNRPLFFDEFAATIRHVAINEVRSKVTYIYHFRSKPRWLSFLFEPIMNGSLQREVQHRLSSLKAFIENRPAESSAS